MASADMLVFVAGFKGVKKTSGMSYIISITPLKKGFLFRRTSASGNPDNIQHQRVEGLLRRIARIFRWI